MQRSLTTTEAFASRWSFTVPVPTKMAAMDNGPAVNAEDVPAATPGGDVIRMLMEMREEMNENNKHMHLAVLSQPKLTEEGKKARIELGKSCFTFAQTSILCFESIC